MSKSLPPIYFYIPPDKINFENLPQTVGAYWQWQCAEHSISPMQSGGCFWTLQTYLYLNDYGFPCQLVDTLPDAGIVVSHRDYLEDTFQPPAKLLLVCLRADVDRHPYAQLHVVQNPYQAIPKGLMTLWESHFIPHWPQPSIIPRDPGRGDTFENVMFLGNAVNLVPEFQDPIWYQELNQLGLKFKTKLSHDQWHDYSDTDVVLAIREFGQTNHWRGKPASKLYNAWHAGVPSILGYESSFQAEKKNELDYLEATSLSEVIAALRRLKEDQSLRVAMVEQGRTRALETSPDTMVKRWQEFLTTVAVPSYHDWCSKPAWQQQAFFSTRKVFLGARPAYYQLKARLSSLLRKN
jgi:hypothetical protein